MQTRSATLELAHQIAHEAGVPIEFVWGFFSFEGRIPTDVQQRIVMANVAVLGMGRDRRTRRKRLRLMAYADWWLEHEYKRPSAALPDAA